MVHEAGLPSEKHIESTEGVIYYLTTNESNQVETFL